jgi:hypothetical protein
MSRFRKRHRLMEGAGDPAGGGSAPAPAPAPASAPAPETFSATYVKELRAESSGYRLKAKELEQQKEAAEAAAKTAQEAADAKIAEATTAAEKRIIRSELKAVAIKAGIVDLDGLKLLDIDAVKLNDQGEVEGAEALIEGLKTSKPYLFGTPGSSSTSTPPGKDPPAAKKASEMTAEEYAEARKVATRR